MPTLNILLILLAIFRVVDSTGWNGDSGPTSQTCTYGDWSVPSTLPGAFRAGKQPREGSLLLDTSGGTLIARDLPLAVPPDDSMVANPEWVAIDLETAKSIASPRPGALIRAPIAKRGNDGSVHVVWAENDSLSLPFRRSDGHWPNATSLWYARRDRVWSEPLLIHELQGSGDLSWSFDGAYGSFVVNRNGQVHIAYIGSDHDGQQLFAHILLKDGAVASRTRLDDLSYGIAVGVAASGDTVWVTYTHTLDETPPAPGEWRENNVHVFVRRSVDSGETWDAPFPVGHQYEGRINPLDLLLGSDGTLHIVFAAGLEPGSRRQAVRYVRVAPDGTWAEPAYLDTPDGFYQFVSALDECGGVHVAYVANEATGNRIHYARWVREWTEPIQPFEGSGGGLALATDDDRVVLYWVAAHHDPASDRWTFEPVTGEMKISRGG